MTIIDSRAGGMGDLIVAFYIAEGLKAAGRPCSFTLQMRHGAHDSLVQMFGQTGTTDPGFDLHSGPGCTGWELTVKGEPIYHKPRAILWQKRLGIDPLVEPARPSANIPLPAMDWAAAHKRSLKGKKLILCFPFCAWPNRDWPLHKWSRLVAALGGHGHEALSTHTWNDPRLLKLGRYFYGYGVDHIAALCHHADLIIGNASGGAMLAGALQRKTIAICGSDDPVASFGHEPFVQCIRSEVPSCSSCRFDAARGYHNYCDDGCDALACISWEHVLKTALEAL